MYYRNAAQRCLALPEIIHEIGRYLTHKEDLLDASCVNKLWKDVLVPLRSHFPHVYLQHLPSFLLFLKSNPRAAYSCHGLRIPADEWDDDMALPRLDDDEPMFDENDWDTESDEEDDRDVEEGDPEAPRTESSEGEGETPVQALVTQTGPVRRSADLGFLTEVLEHIADRGGLEFFMYALPGEPYQALPDSAWTTISRFSRTLQGMYIELVGAHWVPFLTSTFPNLCYLRLFLDSDDFEVNVPAAQRSDPNRLLLDFLHNHPRLETLHIYIGKQFPGLSFDHVCLPRLRSFLLISKAEDVSIKTFLKNHPRVVALDVFTDAAIDPFGRSDLPNVRSLQVSALTANWFRDVIAGNAQRRPEHQIHHLQITAARHANLEDVLQTVSPLGPNLKCLELIFWTREGQIEGVLETVKRVFPNLVELSLFIPSWSVSDEPEPPGPLNLATLLQSYADNDRLRALSISDPLSEYVTTEEIEQLVVEAPSPPNLQYIAWRSQSFRVDQHRFEENGEQQVIVNAKAVGHPRNYRGSKFLRDWYEEMIFNHLDGNYEEQLKVMPR